MKESHVFKNLYVWYKDVDKCNNGNSEEGKNEICENEKKRKEKKREKSDGLTETHTKNIKINQLKTEND